MILLIFELNIQIHNMELNKYSKTITQDETQPAAQAMLYGIGLTEEDDLKAK
jgi:dihydroxy-acid dehydratase